VIRSGGDGGDGLVAGKQGRADDGTFRLVLKLSRVTEDIGFYCKSFF